MDTARAYEAWVQASNQAICDECFNQHLAAMLCSTRFEDQAIKPLDVGVGTAISQQSSAMTLQALKALPLVSALCPPTLHCCLHLLTLPVRAVTRNQSAGGLAG